MTSAPGLPSTLLSCRRAVVTGGSTGIGAATVQALAAAGADVAFCARRREGVERLTTSTALPGRIIGFVADLAERSQLTRFLESVTTELGPPDILVNNVGESPSRNFLRMSDADWTEVFELNLMAAVRCTQTLLPNMRKQGWGRVVMVASSGAKYPTAALVDYSASKAALVAVGKALARKYGADGVLVNSVLPGLIHTPMWDRAADEIARVSKQNSAEVMAQLSSHVPLGRYGTAAEVANIIAFLCSDLASYVSGAAIDIDGALGTSLF